MHSQAFANNALQAIILIEYILGIPQGLSPIFLVAFNRRNMNNNIPFHLGANLCLVGRKTNLLFGLKSGCPKSRRTSVMAWHYCPDGEALANCIERSCL
jgi:hypothetical protein